LKVLIKTQIKTSYDQHLEHILELNDNDPTDTHLKESKQDSQNITTLKDQTTGYLKSNNRDRPIYWTRSFNQFFSSASLLCLKRTCLQKLYYLDPKKIL
jgi:hypothetical protein